VADEPWKLRPARDHGLSPRARLASLGREPGLVGLAMQAAWRRAVRLWLRGFHRLEVVGADHLPPPPFVLVANHTSHLDALVLGACLRGERARVAHALAAGEVFFGSAAGAAFSAYALGALPIWRGRTSTRAIKTLRERLIEDRLVYLLFPEGTRARDGVMGKFQAGLGALVAGTDAKVVPAFIDGAFAAWPPSRRWPRPAPVRVRIGAPLCFADAAHDAKGWAQVAARSEAAVRALG
jgi:1-acyl-sn-glycerol-3-phosphate acyltransferase